ncbi:MAG: DeoR family transcriptional regulator [Chitinophagaceae bacterium]
MANLAKLFKLAGVTVRQDLEKLEGDGMILMEHGGAKLKYNEDQVRSLLLSHQQHLDKKALIAAGAWNLTKLAVALSWMLASPPPK